MLASAFTSPVWYDDAGHWIVARQWAETGSLCYPVEPAADVCDPVSPYITMGPALSFPGGLWMKNFGVEMWKIRMLMVLLSIGVLLVFFRLAREEWGWEKGFWALLLVVGNIQVLVYGAEFLGEVPMLGWLFLGFWLEIRWLKGKGNWNARLAPLAWVLAVLTKEYILIPLGGGLGGLVLAGLLKRDWKLAAGVCLQGLGVIAGLGLFYLVYWGGGDQFLAYLKVRNSYGGEFFALEPGEALRFLLRKPLIWLGALALLLKLWARPGKTEWMMGGLFFTWLLFFLLSAGYDRFGFQLLFVPALYLAEFFPLLWKWVKAKKRWPWGYRITFGLIFMALFYQQSLLVIGKRVLGEGNGNPGEMAVADRLKALEARAVFTYDQQLVPFLPPGTRVRLPVVVPSNSAHCEPFRLRENEYFLAGVYARTEFRHCIPWDRLQIVDSLLGIYDMTKTEQGNFP